MLGFKAFQVYGFGLFGFSESGLRFRDEGLGIFGVRLGEEVNLHSKRKLAERSEVLRRKGTKNPGLVLPRRLSEQSEPPK